ncbi:MAG: hypothetical protein CVU84_14315 [Firmicutes bacterium HGW-Firmicutes-1]|jgi:prevent-host-death family protein|nr:MAG: hypothetical protein CVU84_14315 [Firmicutes bacterium HGW-Firmicutes-1]
MDINSTELKTNFGKYLDLVQEEDIIVTRNGKPVAKLMRYYRYEDVIREGAPDYTYHNKEMTFEEYMDLYEHSDARFEYLDGIVYALSSPNHTHQHILMNIFGVLYTYFKDKKCKPYVAPYDIFFEKSKTKDVIQPDLFVMCDEENVREERYYGVPAFIVEILSSSTRNNDLVRKLNLYLTSGVKEYVVIDPKNKKLHHWGFEHFEIEQMNTLTQEEVFISNIFEGLSLNLSDIFSK